MDRLINCSDNNAGLLIFYMFCDQLQSQSKILGQKSSVCAVEVYMLVDGFTRYE
jgi:hypothetical protein